jgi:type II secretory pathway pseudopilin PulG
MVVVAIVGLLAAIAIPVFTDFARESRLSEANTNIQGILEAEQAYYARFQRYTTALGWCPIVLPAEAWTTRLWPEPADLPADCQTPAGWSQLGWEPDSAVSFQYRVWTHNSGLEECPAPRTPCPSGNCCGVCANPLDPTTFDINCVVVGLGLAPGESGLGGDADLCGVDWNAAFGGGNVLPWAVVEARSDLDLDGDFLFIRGNSYNHRTYRTPNPDFEGDLEY